MIRQHCGKSLLSKRDTPTEFVRQCQVCHAVFRQRKRVKAGQSNGHRLPDEEIVQRWRREVVVHGEALDDEADKGGHVWHSLWAGFVCALGRRDLATYAKYMDLGFPEEG